MLKAKVSTLISLVVGSAVSGWALDPSVASLSPTKGKFISTAFYGHVKSTQDFDNRGEVDFKSSAVGASLGFGISDRTVVAVKGGSYIEPKVQSQGSEYRSRAGYFYGLDLYHQVFPVTDVRPGILAEAGAMGFLVPLDRKIDSSGATGLIDQKWQGVDYHAALLLIWKWRMFSPYLGPRIFGSSVYWRNNQPGPTDAPRISGHAKGNISFVMGSSVRLTPELRLFAEGRVLNETVITAGLQYAAL